MRAGMRRTMCGVGASAGCVPQMKSVLTGPRLVTSYCTFTTGELPLSVTVFSARTGLMGPKAASRATISLRSRSAETTFQWTDRSSPKFGYISPLYSQASHVGKPSSQPPHQ